MKKANEVVLKGVPISEGIAKGLLFFLPTHDMQQIPEFAITNADVDHEISRFKKALSSSKQELHTLQSSLQMSGSHEAITVINAHIQLLDDPMIAQKVEDKIRDLLRNTETVFRGVMQEYEMQMSSLSDAYFQQRAVDVRDLSKKVLSYLYPHSAKQRQSIPRGTIVYSNDLVPSETAEAVHADVQAFISYHGGETSHAALIARSKGIPFVANVDIETAIHSERCEVIVDGIEGVVVLNPSARTEQQYEEKFQTYKRRAASYPVRHEPVCLQDGTQMTVMANIDASETLDEVAESGADGIGLYRSEFLCLNSDIDRLSVEHQAAEYAKARQIFGGKQVVFRMFDFGSDKYAATECAIEQNPALGLRALRFLFEQPLIFRRQIQALVRAVDRGELIVLLPLVADRSEVVEAKRMIFEEINQFPEAERPSSVRVGAMIELPAAVFLSESIAEECDFLSIGTNDLMQYALAVDRANRHVSMRYGMLHPSVLGMIARVIEAVQAKGIPLSMCGEVASDLRYLPIFVGMGVTIFSCNPRHIPKIKARLEATSKQAAVALALKALATTTASELLDLVRD